MSVVTWRRAQIMLLSAQGMPVAKIAEAARPDGAPIYVILDNLSAHLNWRIRRWADRNKVDLCFTPTYASWANPIEAHFGPLRQFTLANSNHPTTPSRHGSCMPPCTGATRTPVTPTSSRPNDANAPTPAAQEASAGGCRPLSTVA
jgi:hypothetical protein